MAGKKIERRGGRRVTKDPRTCVVCGNTFQPTIIGQKTCSMECRKVNNREKRKEWAAKRYEKLYLKAARNVWVDKRCRLCGKRFREKKFATFDNQQFHSECSHCRQLLAKGVPWWEIKYPEVRVESIAAKRERKWRAAHRRPPSEGA